jgi:DNA-binding transcriptional regulator YiaG
VSGKRWSQEELAALRELYPLGRWPALKKALPGRTVAAVRNMAISLEIRNERNPRVAWTGAEKHLLTRLYPSGSWKSICAAIPRHHQSAIAKQGNLMGLKRDGSTKKSRFNVIRELRELRRSKGIQQRYLAKSIGSHTVQLAKWERGEQLPRLASFFDWVQALGYKIRLERAA